MVGLRGACCLMAVTLKAGLTAAPGSTAFHGQVPGTLPDVVTSPSPRDPRNVYSFSFLWKGSLSTRTIALNTSDWVIIAFSIYLQDSPQPGDGTNIIAALWGGTAD